MSKIKIQSKFEKEEIYTDIFPGLPAWLESDEREELMNEVGEYIFSEILDYVGQGISPVTGKPFKNLSEKYADEEKFGDRTANLDLTGSMMRALEFDVQADKIRIGIFDDEEQAQKAHGHNTGFEGHKFLDGKAPKRQFIPKTGQYFAEDIMDGILELIEDYVSEIKRDVDEGEDLG